MAKTVPCPHCGVELNAPDDAEGRKARCTSCGTRFVVRFSSSAGGGASRARRYGAKPRGNATEAADANQAVRERLHQAGSAAWDSSQAIGQDLLTALRYLASNPADGVAHAYHLLGPRRALQAGIICGVIYDVAVLFALTKIALAIRGWRHDISLKTDTTTYSLPLETYVKVALLALVPLAAVTAALFVARKVVRAGGSWQGDVYVAGLVLLPPAIWIVLLALLGLGNLELLSILGVMCFSTVILILYHGFKDLAGVSTRAATLAAPASLILSAYAAKVLTTAIFW